jgi:tRNA (guanine37-N1)-methyltransferase
MRHLSVPSAQTQTWLDKCRTQHWLSSQAGVSRLEGGLNAIPLTDLAPLEGDAVWANNPHIDLPIQVKWPTHWLQHMDQALVEKYDEDWPRSYEIQGDVLIVKLEESIFEYGESIANAMLAQLPNIRLICADLGVKGEFRIRDLQPLASRNTDLETRTRIKENGYLLWVDASKVYFSARLSNERIETRDTAKKLRAMLARPLVVCDPYAGVGPSMGALLNEPELIGGFLVGDLNPDAFELLCLNIEHLRHRRKALEGNSLTALDPTELHCRDALDWAQDKSMHNRADLLLVNLPHHSIQHIESLLPLLKRNQTCVIRGWAIVEHSELEMKEQEIRATVSKSKGSVEQFSFREVKGFSSHQSFMCFELWIRLRD